MAVVVITGGSAGVGRACVRHFAANGYDVGVLARGRAGLAGAVADAEAQGVRARAYPVDVADHEAVSAAAGRVEEELGPIDVWVNNAMATVFGFFWDLTPEEFVRVVDVTFLGQVNGTRAALDRMRPRNRGTIIEVGSALAYRGIPLQSAYCASKHAVQGFVDSLRTELMHEGSAIHLGMVQLPALNTPQFDIQRTRMPRKAQPVPPILHPEVAARAILAAAEQRRREVWVGWPTTRAIVGNRLLPGVLDLVLARTGVEGQQRPEPVDPDAPDALFEPLDHDLGVHGSFGDRARAAGRQVDITLSPALSRLRRLVGRPVASAAARLLERLV